MLRKACLTPTEDKTGRAFRREASASPPLQQNYSAARLSAFLRFTNNMIQAKAARNKTK